jgi:hypothetical protein
MTDEELRKEIDELKQNMKALDTMLKLVIQGGVLQNKRMDTLESFIVATSKLASVASDMISVHLDTLKELAKADMPLPPPPPHEKRQRAPEVA